MADWQRIIEAAAQAASEDSGPQQAGRRGTRDRGRSKRRRRSRLSGGRAFLLGAGLVTAGRVVVAARGRNLLQEVQDRLIEYEERHFGESFDGDAEPGRDDQPVDDADEYEDEPEDEYDDEPEDEYDDEPENEYDDEPENERTEDGEEPDDDEDSVTSESGRRAGSQQS
jgi:hypothetical protein